MTDQIHSIWKAKFMQAKDRATRLENLVIALEAELAKTEEKLEACEAALKQLNVSPYHPTLLQ